MTDSLRKILDWVYTGPNPHANGYFRDTIVVSPQRPQQPTTETPQSGQQLVRDDRRDSTATP